LAGHTHGGQIVLPGGWAPVAPQGPLSRRYLTGRHALANGAELLVSRGVGNSGVPLRYGSPSEVLVCTARASEVTASSPPPP
jgi:predicted MPP superfamily phosphohydrolase